MSGGASRDQRLAQCGARSVEVGALGSHLDGGFDGERFHDFHRS